MKKRIAIVVGGASKERDVSLASAETYIKNINPGTYDVSIYDIPHEIEHFLKQLAEFDLVIPVIHGVGGEDGLITALCESQNIPVFFTASQPHHLTIDKFLCNSFLKAQGIRVPQTELIWNSNHNFILKEGEKVFIKPVHGGSSIDCGICKTQEEVERVLNKITFYDQALVQEVVSGREFTVSIDGDRDSEPKILAISEIITEQEFFDYEAKYTLKNTTEITPAQIDTPLQERIETIALEVYKLCKITCLGRIDLIYNQSDDNIYFLEVNTIPGFTETSFFPQAIQHSGSSIEEYLHNKIQSLLLP